MGFNALPIQPGRVLAADRNSVSASGASVFGQEFDDAAGVRVFRLCIVAQEALEDGIGVELKDTSTSNVLISNSASGAFVGCALVDDNGGTSAAVGQGVLVVTRGRVEAYVDGTAAAGTELVPTASGSFAAVTSAALDVGARIVARSVDTGVAGGKVTIELL